MKTFARLLLVACYPAALAACVYENEPPRRLAPDPPSADPAPPAPGGATATAPASGSASPMLAEVDTNQTMTAEGGQGVGVFIEYAAGGHWQIWWTCDTAKTRQSCEVSIGATASSGNVSNVDVSRLQGGFATQPTASRVDAKSTTSSEVHGLKFDTKPGAVITLEASVGGLKDGAFLFFVQDGKVNGGFTGKLTNPLQLQGKTP